MLLQGAESCDAELAPVLELDDLRFRALFSRRPFLDQLDQLFEIGRTLVGFVESSPLRFSFPRQTPAVPHDQERERPSMLLSLTALPKAFVRNVRPSRTVRIDLQFVRDGTGSRFLPIVELEPDRLIAPLRANPREAAAPAGVARVLDSESQAIREKAEGVEQRTLADSVLPDHDGHRGQGLNVLRVPQPAERQVLQHPVVRDPDSLDLRHGAVFLGPSVAGERRTIGPSPVEGYRPVRMRATGAGRDGGDLDFRPLSGPDPRVQADTGCAVSERAAREQNDGQGQRGGDPAAR